MANGSGLPIGRALRSFFSSFQRTSTQAQSATTQSSTNGVTTLPRNHRQVHFAEDVTVHPIPPRIDRTLQQRQVRHARNFQMPVNQSRTFPSYNRSTVVENTSTAHQRHHFSSSARMMSNQDVSGVTGFLELLEKETLMEERIAHLNNPNLDAPPLPLTPIELQDLMTQGVKANTDYIQVSENLLLLNRLLRYLYKIIVTMENKIDDVALVDRNKHLEMRENVFMDFMNRGKFESMNRRLGKLTEFIKEHQDCDASMYWQRQLSKFLDEYFVHSENIQITHRDFLSSVAQYAAYAQVQLERYKADHNGNYTDGGFARAAVLDALQDNFLSIYAKLLVLEASFISGLNKLERKQSYMASSER